MSESSPYLPPDLAQGCVYGFDPASPALRRALLPQPRPNAIPAAPFAADLPFFHDLLRRQYAGYPDLLQQRGFDPDAFFAAWIAAVRAAGDAVSFHDGVVEPLVALRRALPDQHLLIRGAGPALAVDARLVCREYQAIVPAGVALPTAEAAAAVDGARPETMRLVPLIRPDGRHASVLTLSVVGGGPELPLRCGERELVLRPRAMPATPSAATKEGPAYTWQASGDAAVITVRSFGTSTVVRQQLRPLADDYPAHARFPTLVFDLRNNQGGSLEYVRRWIARAHRGEWRSHPQLHIVGALWPCDAWNLAIERQVVEGVVDAPAAAQERERLRADWSSSPPAPPSRFEPGIRRGDAASPYGGRVFVLINRRSGSSGELAALELKRALGAVIIGERSAGAMQYGEARRFVLPQTGLVCQVPTKRFFFDEPVEMVGVAVDGYLEPIDQDAASLIPFLDRYSALGASPRPVSDDGSG